MDGKMAKFPGTREPGAGRSRRGCGFLWDGAEQVSAM